MAHTIISSTEEVEASHSQQGVSVSRYLNMGAGEMDLPPSAGGMDGDTHL